MRIVIAAIIGTLGVAQPSSADDEPTRISIGGPRQVSAEISVKDESLLVAVKMIPVRSFDVAKNRLINRAKAESYANLALSKYLSTDVENRSRISLSGKEVLGVRETGKVFVLTMQIPTKGIHVEKAPVGKAVDRERTARVDRAQPANVLTIKADYLATIESLASALTQDIPAVPDKAAAPESFFEAVARSEEEGTAAFSAIRKEMLADKLLLSVEKDEIALRIDESEETFLESLRKAVRRWNKAARK